MAVIGIFTATKDGGRAGTIRTLTIDVKARFVPNDNRDSDNAPAFRIYAGRAEIGAAWRKRTCGEEPREYFSIQLDDPSLPQPISAAMFEEAGRKEAQLVWNRHRKPSTPCGVLELLSR